MKELHFVTGNEDKFIYAKSALEAGGIKLLQTPFEIDEIQSASDEKIVKDKAHKAFDILKKPLIVSDDSWDIPALNGFPGAYMKFVNGWFETQDFLNLMKDKTDQTVYLVQNVVYKDDSIEKVFTKRVKGRFLKEPDDIAHKYPITKVVTFTPDGMSLARIRLEDPERLATATDNVWGGVASWLKYKS